MAAPTWTVMKFTTKLNSTPSKSSTQFTPTLPHPFTVAINGASRNIGAVIAKAFAQAGTTGIILTSTTDSRILHDTKKDVDAAASFPDIRVNALPAEIGDPSSARLVADTTESSYGRLDPLINSAAVVRTHESAFNKFESIGKFATIQAPLLLLLESKGVAKSIVNIKSAMLHSISMGAIGYKIFELATNRLTEEVAEAYTGERVLDYAVHPGIVATMPRPIGIAPEALAWAIDDVGFCGAFLLWLVKERREWLSGRYLSANWDIDEL